MLPINLFDYPLLTVIVAIILITLVSIHTRRLVNKDKDSIKNTGPKKRKMTNTEKYIILPTSLLAIFAVAIFNHIYRPILMDGPFTDWIQSLFSL